MLKIQERCSYRKISRTEFDLVNHKLVNVKSESREDYLNFYGLIVNETGGLSHCSITRLSGMGVSYQMTTFPAIVGCDDVRTSRKRIWIYNYSKSI